MSAICIIDTTVFLEILNVPNKATLHKNIIQELETKIKNEEVLFMPMATIIETGNHIAQNGNGHQKRKAAEKFVEQINLAIEGKSPFTPIDFLTKQKLSSWLAEFPNLAMTGLGIGDVSIIKDWEFQCSLHLSRRVYIWTLDCHLQSYDRAARI